MSDVVMIVDSILVDEAELAPTSPYGMFEVVNDFFLWASSRALLRPGEYPIEATLLANTGWYWQQIQNGGHWQFAWNSEMDRQLLANIEKALHLMGATENSKIFADFLRLMAPIPDPRKFFAPDGAGDRKLPPELGELDDRFYSCDEELYLCCDSWLHPLPSIKRLSAAELAAAKAAILALPYFPARQAEVNAEEEAAEAADAKLVAAKALCTMHGLTFQNLTAGSYEGLQGDIEIIRWGMQTNQGLFFVLVTADRAELHPSDSRTALAEVRLTRVGNVVTASPI
jgi:hypothetical protein